MPVFLLTDADRFPFDAEDRSAMAEAGVELRELPGHEPEERRRRGAGRRRDLRLLRPLPAGDDRAPRGRARARALRHRLRQHRRRGGPRARDRGRVRPRLRHRRRRRPRARPDPRLREDRVLDRASRRRVAELRELAPMFRLRGRTSACSATAGIGRRSARGQSARHARARDDPYVAEATATRTRAFRGLGRDLGSPADARDAARPRRQRAGRDEAERDPRQHRPRPDRGHGRAGGRPAQVPPRGAALDVYEEALPPADHPLQRRERRLRHTRPRTRRRRSRRCASAPSPTRSRIVQGETAHDPVPA